MKKADKWRRVGGLLGRQGAEEPGAASGAPTCNVCGYVASAEAAKGKRVRICPSCDTNQRQRSFKQLFTEVLEPRVFSAGTWNDALLLSPGAVERSLLAPKFRRHTTSSLYQSFPGGNFVKADVVDLAPFADASFDFVEACNVLDYIPEMERAIQSIRRVTRPTGMFVFLNQEQNLMEGDAPLTVTVRTGVTGSYWPDKDRVPCAAIGRRTLAAMLARNGFAPEEVRLTEPLSGAPCTWWVCCNPQWQFGEAR